MSLDLAILSKLPRQNKKGKHWLTLINILQSFNFIGFFNNIL
ncbi:conserved hypothetical protein [Enhydrobacter sp. AX1]|nr:conserved hypothetical protein [Enhydrobacter sp. AX1]